MRKTPVEFIGKLEKSNKAKTKVSHFISSSMFTSRIRYNQRSISSALIDGDISVEERKKLFFGALPNILDLKVLIRGVMIT